MTIPEAPEPIEQPSGVPANEAPGAPAAPSVRAPEASFEPPPTGPGAPGAISLHVSIVALLDWSIEGAVVAIALGAAVLTIEGAALSIPIPVLVVSLSLLAALWAVLVRIEEPRSKRVRWDAWGVTEEGGGVRVALAWAGARARVERSSTGAVAEVRDEDGRTIRVATGVLFSRALRQSACWTSRRELDAFVSAIARLPRHDAITTPALPISRVVSAAWVLPLALMVLASRHVARTDGGPVFVGVPIALALASLLLPLLLALAGIGAQLARARALRGARWARIAGGAGEPLRVLRDDGTSIPLALEAVHGDARIGERGDRVRLLFAAPRADEEGPYRGREMARARALETRGERRDRLRVIGASLARVALVGAAIATIAVGAAGYDPYAGAQPMFTGPVPPRPPAPTAWPIAPRPPESSARSGPAPFEGPGGGYAMRTIRRCDASGVCANVYVVTVWATGEEIVCEGDAGRARCGRFMRGR